jgi:hypothetical protein
MVLPFKSLELARPPPRTRRDSRRDEVFDAFGKAKSEMMSRSRSITYAALLHAVPDDRSALPARDNKTSSLDLA